MKIGIMHFAATDLASIGKDVGVVSSQVSPVELLRYHRHGGSEFISSGSSATR